MAYLPRLIVTANSCSNAGSVPNLTGKQKSNQRTQFSKIILNRCTSQRESMSGCNLLASHGYFCVRIANVLCFVQHNIPPSVLGTAATVRVCISSQLIVRRVTTQYPVPHYDWCSSQSSSGCHGTRQSSSSGRNGEVAQQSPDDSSEGVLANGSSVNLTSISGTDPGQNTQSTAISHQSSQSNESQRYLHDKSCAILES